MQYKIIDIPNKEDIIRKTEDIEKEKFIKSILEGFNIDIPNFPLKNIEEKSSFIDIMNDNNIFIIDHLGAGNLEIYKNKQLIGLWEKAVVIFNRLNKRNEMYINFWTIFDGDSKNI